MPDKLTNAILRTYEVGFGDCFLLTFQYTSGDGKKAEEKNVKEKHVLIDFGSTGRPDGMPRDQMFRVADDIAKRCKNQLDIVVATHRHKDHISGFATDNGHKNTLEGPNAGLSTGEIIRNCNPKLVIQPWTEDPDLAADAKGPAGNAADDNGMQALNPRFTQSLHNMNLVSEGMRHEIGHLSDTNKFNKTLLKPVSDRLSFMAENNGLRNASAVENLSKMSGNPPCYVNYGFELKLEELLPGVNVKVLGPPNLDQYSEIEKQRSSDREEFWMLYAATAEMRRDLIDSTTDKDEDKEDDILFSEANEYQRTIPDHCRWFVRRLRNLRADQLFQIVRVLDDAMNNTSVILMFDTGKQKFLFPGDAQIENWEYALKVAPDCNDNLKLLGATTLYKVGHHGSRNATPKKLWSTFSKRNKENKDDRLKTVISTMTGKHGNPDRQTEVPRQSLVDALSGASNFYTTQSLGAAPYPEDKCNKFSKMEAGLWGEIEIDLI